MFAAFLHPFPFRGLEAPLLWVFYRLVSQLGGDVVYLLSEDYLVDPQHYAKAGRWELSDAALTALGYEIPTATQLAELPVEIVPADWVKAMQRRYGSDPIEPWRHFLLRRDEALEQWIIAALDRQQRALGQPFEGVWIWNNCLALRHAVRELGLPLLHWELGPLRKPQFRQTVYLDRLGVNGGTEAEARFIRACESGDILELPSLSSQEIASLLSLRPQPQSLTPEFEIGVPLQVDDDSNLVAYGNGFSNTSLIAAAMRRCSSPERVLVRNHPNRSAPLPSGSFTADRSENSTQFIARCERVLTINSGVGAEALLLNVPVEALGDSPYGFVTRLQAGSAARAQALRFFFLCYLVPWNLLFDADYARWRLKGPSEVDIALRHLAVYGVVRGD